MDEERQMMDVWLKRKGHPLSFSLLYFVTARERLVHALPRRFFVAEHERLVVLPAQASKI
jgi:hypothetical protein